VSKMGDQVADKRDQLFDLTLMSNFVHQVVNPLNAVCGTLDNIANDDVPAGSIKQRIRASRSQIEYCVELIRNMAFLAEYHRDPEGYAKLHVGGVTVIPQCLIDAAQFFQETARKKRMKIHLTDRETQYKVNADRALLRQVFINIFDNCVKYGHQATDVIVNCHVQKKSGDLLLEIINSGDPVPRDLWGRIFEAGFRGENARQLVATGTGLGLYICRLILSVYQGTIEYRGRSNNESIFTIRIPKAWV
jgi:K+-sensing histidine kinase KdpD